MTHPLYASAAALDERLGDPRDPGRVFSYRRSADADAREQFPVEICRELDFLQVPRHYVPVGAGGSLARFDHALQMLRAIARRDLTVAIGHGKTFLGAASVWVAGSPEQRRHLGAQVAAGSAVSWGLTERDHGSDLMAGEVTARPEPGGYRLDGEKWLINNATRGRLICVLARTGAEPGPRGLSVLLVDKHDLPPGAWEPLPGEPLHGIRGADISGIRFTAAQVPGTALVGREGEGLEIVLKTLQLTRVLCAALSLGAADHAVRLALDFARSRERFGRRMSELPQTRRILARSVADLLLVEAVTLVGGRAVHALPAELAPISAATKFLLPTMVQRLLADVTEVIGARSLLVDDTFEAGRLAKLNRDHRLVGIFDGSTVVNLHALVTGFPLLAPGRRAARCDEAGLAAAVDPDADLPPFDPGRLALLPRHGSSLLHALPRAAAEVAGLARRDEVGAGLAAHVVAFADRTAGVLAQVGAYRPTARDHPAEAFDLAADLARCLAGAAAVHLWSAGRRAAADGPTAPLWERGLWLEAALARSRAQLDPGAVPPGDVLERLADAMEDQHARGLATSLLAYPLDPPGRPRPLEQGTVTR